MNLYCYILLLIFLSQVFTKPSNNKHKSKQIAKHNTAPPALKRGHIRNVVQPKLRKLHKADKSIKSNSGRNRASVSKKRMRKKVIVKSDPKIVKPNAANQRLRKKVNRKRRMKSRIKTANDVMPQDAPLTEKSLQANKNVNSHPSVSNKKIKRKRLLRKVKRKRVKSSKKRRKKTNRKPQLAKKLRKEKSSNDVLQDQNISKKEDTDVKANNVGEGLKQKDEVLIKADKIPSKVVSKTKDEKRKIESVSEQLPESKIATKELNRGLYKIDTTSSTAASNTKVNLIITTEESSTSTEIIQEIKTDSTTAKFGNNLFLPYFQGPRTTTPKTYDPDIADLLKIREEYEQNLTKLENYYRSHKRPPKPAVTPSPAEIAEFEAKGFMKHNNFSFPIPNLCAKHYEMVKRRRAQNTISSARFPACTRDGLYERAQCELFIKCICVDPHTGNPVPGNCWKPSKYEQQKMKRREEKKRAKKEYQETLTIIKNNCKFYGSTYAQCSVAIFDDVIVANSDIPAKIIKEYNIQTNSVDRTAGRSRREMEQRALEILNDVQHKSRECRYIIDQFPFLEPYLRRHTESCYRNSNRYMNAKFYKPFDWKAKALALLDKDQ